MFMRSSITISTSFLKSFNFNILLWNDKKHVKSLQNLNDNSRKCLNNKPQKTSQKTIMFLKLFFHIVIFLMNRLGVDILLVYVDSRVVFL